MNQRLLIAAAPLALLLAAGCSKAPVEPADANAAAPMGNDSLDSGDNAADLAAAASDAGNDAAANAAAPASPPAAGLLSAYVGKYPFDKVEGRTFLDQPSVKAAVAATVGDAGVRKFVFTSNGPNAPIVLKDGRLLAWGCEAHNCGYHNWTIAITPDGGDAQVCFYHNDESAEGASTWYLPGGRTEKRAGNCPSD